MADPKNKWNQPAAPPAPMFFGKKERDLVKQVNDELSERVIGQPIAYYPISTEESNFNETYGEAIEKVSLPPIRVYAYVDVANEQSNEKFGYEYQSKLTVYFSERRITEDQNLYVRVGDFIQYGEFFYEIVKTFDDTRYYFGQVEHKFQIAAECVRARKGTFRVMPSVDRPTTETEQAGEVDNPAPRPAPYPPLAASYVTMNTESKLPNERILTAGEGITITDGGPNRSVTIAASGQNAVGPTGSLQLQAGAGSFTGVGELTFLTASNRLGVGTDAPTHEVTVVGGLSASADSIFASDVTIKGTLVGGSPLKVSGGIEIVDQHGAIVGNFNKNGHGLMSVSASCIETGDLSASLYVSSSMFYSTTTSASYINLLPTSGTLAGLGSYLALDAQNNIIITSSLGGSAVDGIFTVIDGSSAYVTSSLAIGGTTAPDHKVSISGSLSASVNISASAFYGDGSNLTGITASAVQVADGPIGSLQFRVDSPVTGEISGSSKILYDISNNRLSFGGGLTFNRTAISTVHTASVSNYILGVTAVPTEIEFDATLFSDGQGLVIKDESGTANGTDSITLKPSGSQTIDGASVAIIESPHGSVFMYSNGTNWFIY